MGQAKIISIVRNLDEHSKKRTESAQEAAPAELRTPMATVRRESSRTSGSALVNLLKEWSKQIDQQIDEVKKS